MNARTAAVLMLVVAAILGVVVVLLVRSLLQEPADEQATRVGAPPVTTVVVAAVDLGFGDVLNEQVLREARWPEDAMPAGSFQSIDALLEGGQERVALRTIKANEPILPYKVSGLGGRATLSSLIDPKKRAVTIRVNDVVGVAGFILPGDRVDVLLTRSEGRDQGVTNVVLQDIQVLGVDQQAAEDREQPLVAKAVTLEVTPKQAQKLALASQVGILTLALRGEADTTPAYTGRISVGDLATVDTEVAAAEPEPAPAPTPAAEEPAPAPKPAARRSGPRFVDVTVTRQLKTTKERVIEEQSVNPLRSSPTALSPGQ